MAFGDGSSLTDGARLVYVCYESAIYATLVAPGVSRLSEVSWQFTPGSAMNTVFLDGRSRDVDDASVPGDIPKNRGVSFGSGTREYFAFAPSPALIGQPDVGDESLVIDRSGESALFEYRVELDSSARARDVESTVVLLFAEDGDEGLDETIRAESEILGSDAFMVRGGAFGGYDATRGAYVIQAPSQFAEEGPGGPLQAGPAQVLTVTAHNSLVPRTVRLLVRTATQRPTAGSLADAQGFLLPELTQSSQGPGGMEVLARMPLRSRFDSRTVRLMMVGHSWGPLPAQTLTMRTEETPILQHSTGGRETASFSPRPRTLTDFQAVQFSNLRSFQGGNRNQPAPSMGFGNWFQDEWNYLNPMGVRVHHSGPLYTDYEVDYNTADGSATGRLRVRQFSQTDAVRIYLDARLDFEQQLRLPDTAEKNLRLFSFTTAGTRLKYNSLIVREAAGLQTYDLQGSNTWATVGAPLSRRAGYAALQGGSQGNVAAYVLEADGAIGRVPLTNLGLSAFDGGQFTDMNFTVPNDVTNPARNLLAI